MGEPSPPLHVKPLENPSGNTQSADTAWALWALASAIVISFIQALLAVAAMRAYRVDHEILDCATDAPALALVATAVLAGYLASVALFMRMRGRLRSRMPQYLRSPSRRGKLVSLCLGLSVLVAALAFDVVLIASDLYTH